MSRVDQEWLDAINNERRSDQLNKVTYETFEIIMDKLEKEWFDLVRLLACLPFPWLTSLLDEEYPEARHGATLRRLYMCYM